MSLNDETTVSCNFEFFEKYLRNAKDMMNNRVCLLIDYENANRNLEKAKTGSKRQAVSALSGSIFIRFWRVCNTHCVFVWRVYLMLPGERVSSEHSDALNSRVLSLRHSIHWILSKLGFRISLTIQVRSFISFRTVLYRENLY